MEPMKPLECWAGHVKNNDGDTLIVRDLVEGKEMVDLK